MIISLNNRYGRTNLRLNKFIAECGVCSRRAAEDYIKKGQVTVNGKPAVITTEVDPENDRVVCAGKRIRIKACDKQYFMFYKPRGVITAMKAQDDRSVIAELIKGIKGRVFPVGRLDRDSEGMLILTDDGDLSQRLCHPSYRIPKTYRVTIKGKLSPENLEPIRKGMSLEDETEFLPAEVMIHSQTEEKTVLHITLYEGKNREIRRMCEELGFTILLLKRISIAEVGIGRLSPGEYRPLSHQEITKLFHAVDMKVPVFKRMTAEANERMQKNRRRASLNKTSNQRRFERQIKQLGGKKS